MLKTWMSLALIASSIGYLEEIQQERIERNAWFRDPDSSPLATVAIRLLEQEEITFGSSPEADLIWEDAAIRPRQLTISQEGGKVFVERIQGKARFDGSEEDLTKAEWEVNQLLDVGPIWLALQIHPAGPVIRVIDPNNDEFRRFTAIPYYPIDTEYRVEGVIEPGLTRKITIIDTQGWQRPVWLHGKIRFTLHGEQQTLDLILSEENPTSRSRFMLIFRDKTSGQGSYAACRYLYVPFQPKGKTWIDFNKTFNPYCAYGDGFACPLPLPGNILTVQVAAGEKDFPRKH